MSDSSTEKALEPVATAEAVSIDTTVTMLTLSERARLAFNEDIIEHGFAAIFDMGLALAEINRKRLWRGKFGSFKQYCGIRWGKSANYARRIITFALEVQELEKRAHGHALPRPENERVYRPLLKLPPAQRGPAWDEVCKRAGTRKPTYKDSEAVAAEFLGGTGGGVAQTVSAVVTGVAPGTALGHVQAESAVSDGGPDKVAGGRERKTVSNKEDPISELDRIIAELRVVLETVGTADSVVVANGPHVLEELHHIKAHLLQSRKQQAEMFGDSPTAERLNRERLAKYQAAKAGLTSEAA